MSLRCSAWRPILTGRSTTRWSRSRSDERGPGREEMISEAGKAILSEPSGRSFGGAGKQARQMMVETRGLLLDDLVPEAARATPIGDLAIAGINADSRALQAGEAFFALPGSRQ